MSFPIKEIPDETGMGANIERKYPNLCQGATDYKGHIVPMITPKQFNLRLHQKKAGLACANPAQCSVPRFLETA
jgi:hypothetical protein